MTLKFRTNVQGTGGCAGLHLTRTGRGMQLQQKRGVLGPCQEREVRCERQTSEEGRMGLPKLQWSWTVCENGHGGNGGMKSETRQSLENWGF